MADTAVTVERDGEVVGAAFPRYSIQIVRVPFFDPDRDGAMNGYTHELQLSVSGKPLSEIGRGTGGKWSGATGSIKYLGELLRRSVAEFNEANRGF